MRTLQSINKEIIQITEEMSSLEGEGAASSSDILLCACLGAISDKLDLVIDILKELILKQGSGETPPNRVKELEAELEQAALLNEKGS